MRLGPPSFSFAKTKIVSPLAMCLPAYIVFCALNANVSAHESLTSALIANIIPPWQAVASREGCSSLTIISWLSMGVGLTSYTYCVGYSPVFLEGSAKQTTWQAPRDK